MGKSKISPSIDIGCQIIITRLLVDESFQTWTTNDFISITHDMPSLFINLTCEEPHYLSSYMVILFFLNFKSI